MTKETRLPKEIEVPSPHDWRTTDVDEINKRRLRAREEDFTISNLERQHPIFSNFQVQSGSGMNYSVEIRDIRQRQFSCNCVDYRINGLGTCKHVEAVLLHLEGRFRRLMNAAAEEDSYRYDVVPDSAEGTLRLANPRKQLPRVLEEWFDKQGFLSGSPEDAMEGLKELQQKSLKDLRLSQDIQPWLEGRRRLDESKLLRREYEQKVQSGEWPIQETSVPLFPYQREGMLHLAFTERALLADEMGLGKTIQAIAACALLHRLNKAKRVLVVTPASLKTEWDEQIRRFTGLPLQLVFGARHQRLKAYANPPFFTVVNYEQMVADGLDVNNLLKPDVIVLDEAQRIKNWNTKTAQAIKRLKSRYAFVLTGTPLENRIDEIHSLMDFLNPEILGPLFRFNRDFYQLDERGRPAGYKNLDQLHRRIKPLMLRRKKTDVENELPARTDQNHFVKMSDQQTATYDECAKVVNQLIQKAKRRPLTKEEQERLQRFLAMMRMICDSNYILDPNDKICPKLNELEKIIDECRENDAKVIIFSEWERMLELVKGLCKRMGVAFAWHTGSVPQMKRRGEINMFKTDPECRVFLSTDSGATGLNLQVASVVINCDLPWNPAKLEQRIARAWRKNQTRPVLVINLVSENTIEHKMLGTLASKQALADSVLELKGDLKEMQLGIPRQSFLSKLQQIMSAPTPALLEKKEETAAVKPPLPADRAKAFAERAREQIGNIMVRSEERYPQNGSHSVIVVVVERDAHQWQPRLNELHEELFGQGKWDPLSPVRFEVIDRATDQAIKRLMDAGLIARTSRGAKISFPDPSVEQGPEPLSPEEQTKADGYLSQATRRIKMAKLLGEGGLDDEARLPLLDAILYTAKRFAVINRQPEPGIINDALVPPLSACWGESLTLIREFMDDVTKPWKSVLEAIIKMLA